MTRPSNLGTWIDIAKLGMAAGELAPFPYIKGLCGCAVLVLEAIEKASKNNEDLLDLADNVQKTIEMVKSTVTEQGESSALRFRDVCVELEVQVGANKYLTDLHIQLNGTRRNSRGIKRFLKTRDVSDTIKGYQGRVSAIKEDFLLHTVIDSRFGISDIKDELRASTSAIETSGQLTMSNINNLRADVQALKEQGLYKGSIREVLLGDIYLREHLNYSYSQYSLENNDIAMFSYHSADVEGSNAPKTVHKFHTDVDMFIHFKHPNFAQIFGVCRSPRFTAIILHGTIRHTVRNHASSLTAVQLWQFHIQLFNDLKVLQILIVCMTILNNQISLPQIIFVRFTINLPMVGLTGPSKDGDLSSMYIDERGRVVFSNLSSRYDLFYYTADIIRDRKKDPGLISLGGPPMSSAMPTFDLLRNLNSLLHCTILERNYLVEIYDALYILTYTPDMWAYPPGLQFSYNLGSIYTRTGLTPPVDCLVVGQILLELTEQNVAWEVRHNNGDTTSILPVCSGSPTTHHLSTVQNHCLTIFPYLLRASDYFKNRRRMVHSLFAKASRLPLSHSPNPIDSNHHMVHGMKDIEVCHSVLFQLQISPCYDPFQLLDTFMADSEYIFALSLTVSEPRLDSQSSRFSWPVMHWFCDPNLSNEISVEEVETLFGVKVNLRIGGYMYHPSIKLLSTMVEINTMCGFDPALEGADICEYLDLPRMEIFENPVEVIADREFNQIASPEPVHGHRDKDPTDVTPVTYRLAEKEPLSSRAENRLVVISIALNIVLLSLVAYLFIGV
ncbi:hypothetical protein IW261DRAFT_1678303 [Armillaria novae-zelandiae]|uniref:Uncharacterized protein n=1 Tax=Armillaria novae-zelandiae TaxID=153914 RepID=A0AA39UKD7_9AGAR|nr:hypothetical protein IW261DRAFT_1678303 [Armillaria novae-zelandiae]